MLAFLLNNGAQPYTRIQNLVLDLRFPTQDNAFLLFLNLYTH